MSEKNIKLQKKSELVVDPVALKDRLKERNLLKSICARALFYGEPGQRQGVIELRNFYQRMAAETADGELRQYYKDAEAVLSKNLDRTKPDPKAGSENPGPTPQTLERLQPDYFADHIQSKSSPFTPAEQTAALEIRKIYDALTRSMGARSGHMDTAGRSTSKRLPKQPLSKLRAGEEHAYLYHYRPWANQLMKNRAQQANLRSPNHVDMTMRILADGMNPHDIDQLLGLEPTTAYGILQKSLALYVRIMEVGEGLE